MTLSASQPAAARLAHQHVIGRRASNGVHWLVALHAAHAHLMPLRTARAQRALGMDHSAAAPAARVSALGRVMAASGFGQDRYGNSRRESKRGNRRQDKCGRVVARGRGRGRELLAANCSLFSGLG